MAKKITQGNVTIEVADNLVPPDRAGTMTVDEMATVQKARTGVGLAADAAASAIEILGAKFVPPAKVTPQVLREAAAKAEQADIVITNIELLLSKFRQANLIWDAECAALLGLVNDQVKAQGKHDESIRIAFQAVSEYFANQKAKKAA